jgi:DNA-binding CsgD family transcriptional regulator
MTTATWVDAGPFRAHLQHLMRSGDLTAGEVAALAGISVRAADSLLLGRHGRPVRRISHATALALLDVRPQHAQALRTSQVPASGSRARLLRLLAEGATVAGLADQLGTGADTVSGLVDGTLLWCPALTALRLVTLVRFRATAGAAVPSGRQERAVRPRAA